MAQRLEILVSAIPQETQIPIDPAHWNVSIVLPQHPDRLPEHLLAISQRFIRPMHARRGKASRYGNKRPLPGQPDPQFVVERGMKRGVHLPHSLEGGATEEGGRLADEAFLLEEVWRG